MKKLKSHLQRLNTEFSADICNPSKNEEFVTESVTVNGRLSKQTSTKVVDPRSKFEKFKTSDFYLENILAVDPTFASDANRVSTLRSNDVDSSLRSMDAAVASADRAYALAEYEKAKQQQQQQQQQQQ